MNHLLLSFIFFLFVCDLNAQNPDPVELPRKIELEKVNEELKGINVREAYKLTDDEKIIIGSLITDDPTDVEGLRLFRIKINKRTFVSNDIGEHYFYHPYFYKFQDNIILIVCEKGFEYFDGIDVFELRGNRLRLLGNIDIAGKGIDGTSSVIPLLIVERYGTTYDFRFSDKVILNPGDKNASDTDGNILRAQYSEGAEKITMTLEIK